MAPGSSMLADSCGATQLKEGLSVSSDKGEGPAPLIEYNVSQERCTTKKKCCKMIFNIIIMPVTLSKRDLIQVFPARGL